MTPFNNVEGLNSARQAIIDSTLSRCQKTNQDYTITLPTPQPLGKIVCGLPSLRLDLLMSMVFRLLLYREC